MSEEQVLLSVLLEQPSSFCDPFQIILLREDRSGVEGGAASRADLVLQRAFPKRQGKPEAAA